ncbi:hypothetical protein EsHS_00001274 [Epichloe bromicola]
MTVSKGCGSALEHTTWAFGNPGDVLLGKPYYGTFVPDVTLRMGTQLAMVDFHGTDAPDHVVTKLVEDEAWVDAYMATRTVRIGRARHRVRSGPGLELSGDMKTVVHIQGVMWLPFDPVQFVLIKVDRRERANEPTRSAQT